MSKSIGRLLVIVFLCANAICANAAKSTVSVVVGKDAPELERFAASELCGYLNKLFGLDVVPTSQLPSHAGAIFMIGSPASNPLIDTFPKVSEQGVVIKKMAGSKNRVVVGGGSPRATLWAVYELAERWGVRYLLDRDAIPPQTTFHMPTADVIMEPIFKVRAHPTVQDFADSGEAWGLKDFKPLVAQLAKMKYNRLNIFAFGWQPYLEYEVEGIKRKTAALWYGYHYPITPDMPGRSAFPADMTEFWNPDLPIHGTPDEVLRAGVGLHQALIDYAHAHGMECVVNAAVSEYPKEFASVLGGSVPIRMLNELTTAPGPSTTLDDPGLHKLSSSVLRATIDSYPKADRVNISINEWRQWTNQYKRAWSALDQKYQIGQITTLDHVLDASQHRVGYNFTHYTQAQLDEKAADEVKGDLASLYFFDWLVRGSDAVSESKRPDMKFLYWGFAEELFPLLPKVLPPNSELEVMPDNFPTHLLKRADVLQKLSGDPIQPIISLTVDDDNIGIVPQMTTSSLQKVLKILRETGWQGFVARERFPGDHDTELAYLARAAWDANADPDVIAGEQLKAACGERCGAELLTTMHSIDAATLVWERDDQHFTSPVPDMLTIHWKAGPMPAYLEENRKNYERGWQAAQRAVVSATPEGKDLAIYWTKRMEFTVNFITAIESVRRAATAEEDHHPQDALTEANLALSQLRESIEAYAAVARNQTDRGAIAIAVEYGYRGLEKKIAALKQ